MNDSQKTVVVLAAVAVVASIVFCPYVVTSHGFTSTEYGWIFDAPYNSSLDFARLAITWVAIVVGGLVLFAVNAGSGKK